jgi:hypothetical protein
MSFFLRFSSRRLLTDIGIGVLLKGYFNGRKESTVYFCDFVRLGDERFYVSVDTRTASIRLERISNEALERFIRNVLSMGEGRTIPAAKKEMSV